MASIEKVLFSYQIVIYKMAGFERFGVRKVAAKKNFSSKIQKKVSHYFRSLRKRRRMSQEEYSYDCAFSLSQIKRFEGTKSDSSVSKAIVLLSEVGQLSDKNIFEFFQYVMGKKIPNPSLDNWESILLEKMSHISLTLREEFIHGYLNSLNSKSELNNMIETLLALRGLSSYEYKAIANMATALKRARNDKV